MTAQTDHQLLQAHASGESAAFAELVRRHVDWLHGVARRRVGDAHLAEDVTQATFVVLARRSREICPHTLLTGWLFRTACHIASNVRRDRTRRALRERVSVAMRGPDRSGTTDGEWEALAPLIDEFVGQLRQPEREAILLRFYRQMTYAQVGELMQTSEEAARKRVTRALERLRALAARRGLTFGAASIAGVLTGGMTPSAAAAPAGMTALIATTVNAGATSTTFLAIAPATLAKGALLMSATTKMAVAVGAVALVIGAALLVPAMGVGSSSAPVAVTTSQPVTTRPGAASQPAPEGNASALDPGVWTKEMNDAGRSMKIACLVVIGSAAAGGGYSPTDLGATLSVAASGRTSTEIAAIYLTPADVRQTAIPDRIDADWVRAHTSYVYLAASVPMENMAESGAAGTTVLFHTSQDRPFQHPDVGECIMAAFVDGHIEVLTLSQAETAIARSKQQITRARTAAGAAR